MTKTQSQKARARKQKTGAHKNPPPQPRKGRNAKKWYVEADTAWGKYKVGTDRPLPKKKGRTRNGGLDVVSFAPEESGTRPSLGRPQIIEQDEFVAIVSGSSAFSVTSWQTNPGLALNFPWLARVAPLYERWKVVNWEYYFKPTVSEFNAMGQAGKVIMSFDYDTASSMPIAFVEMEGMSPHVDGMPYQNLRLPLQPARMTPSNGKFVRTAAPPAGTDIRNYDGGLLYFGSVGCGGTGAVGELRVRYTVELMNPRLVNNINAPVNFKTSGFTKQALTLVSTVVTPVVIAVDGNLGNGLSLPVSGSGQLTMGAGIYQVSGFYNVSVSGGICTAFQMSMSVNGTPWPAAYAGFIASGGSFLQDLRHLSTVIALKDGDVLSFNAVATFTGTCALNFWVQIATI